MLKYLLLLFLAANVYADTPPPGTVTAKQGAPNTVGNAWPVKVTDGTNTATVSAGGAVKVDASGSTQPISGTVAVSNFPSIQPVSQSGSWSIGINNFPATQAVTQSGTWSTGRTWTLLNTTDSVNVGNFPASQTINGTVAATQSGAWTTGRTWSLLNTTDSVNVGNFPATFGVTQSTSPWVVSGTVTANAGTGTFLVDGSAHTQPVSGSGNFTVVQPTGTNLHVVVDSAPSTPVTGTVTANQGTSPWVVSGTVTSNIGTTNGLALDTSVNGLQVSQGSTTSGQKGGLTLGAVTTAAPSYTTAQTSPLSLTTAGALRTDGSATTQPISGSVSVSNFPATQAVTQSTSPWVVSGTVAATQSGAWTTGRTWSLLNTTDSVNVGNFPASQVVSQPTAASLNATVVQSSGANLHVNVDSAPTTTVTGTVAVTQSTSPWVVSTAQLPTTLGAKTTANSTAVNIASDQTVPISGSVSVSNFPATTAVTQSTSPWVENVSQFGGSNVVTGVGNSGAGIPRFTISSDSNITNISGTVSLPTGAATSANQTSGGQKSQIVDGSNATVGPVTTLSAVNYLPVIQASSSTPGSAIPARATLVAGSDGTNARSISTDTSGNQNVNIVSTTTNNTSTSVNLVRNDYSSTNVTTAAYVQLVASTADVINQLYIFDSSGQTLFLAVGGAGSEVNKAYIVPGGNGILNLTIPASSRVSVKAVSASATSGELSITFLK